MTILMWHRHSCLCLLPPEGCFAQARVPVPHKSLIKSLGHLTMTQVVTRHIQVPKEKGSPNGRTKSRTPQKPQRIPTSQHRDRVSRHLPVEPQRSCRAESSRGEGES